MIKLIKEILEESMEKRYGKEFNLPEEMVKELYDKKEIKVYYDMVDLYKHVKGLETLYYPTLNDEIKSLLLINPSAFTKYNSLVEGLLDQMDLPFVIMTSTDRNDVLTLSKNTLNNLKNYERWLQIKGLSGRQYSDSPAFDKYYELYRNEESPTATKEEFKELLDINNIVIHTNRNEFLAWFFNDNSVALRTLMDEFFSLDSTTISDYPDLFEYFKCNCLHGATLIEDTDVVMYIY